jgi:cytochrome c oxidase subunit 2
VSLEPARSARRALPVAIALTAGGCAWNLPQSSLVAHSDYARAILHVYAIIVWVAVGIATLVAAILIWVLLRYRGGVGAPLPRQIRGHSALEIAWTIAPAIVLLVIAVPTIEVVFRTQAPAPPGALEVVVHARQWWWDFEYPSLGVTTANEPHLPLGRPVTLRLEGDDVIHSFWVPGLGGKRDVVPGRTNVITFTPDTPGEYPGQCAEFCGTSHANMGMRVFVDPPDAFARWVAGQRSAPVEPAGDEAAQGKTVFARNACVGCHTIRGVSGGVLGPDLTHFGSRTTLAGGLLANTAANVAAWVRDPGALKPGAKMPNLGLSEADARALAQYLVGLK